MNKDILVYNNWDPLEEIWLGDTYPEHFYEDFDSEIRDNFCKVTEYTKEDLNIVQKKFEEFGVTVRRPTFKNKEHYFYSNTKKLMKPPICPRDDNAVIGDKLYYTTYYGGVWEEIAKIYNSDIQKQDKTLMSGAGIVKLGQDIIFDCSITNSKQKKEEQIKTLFYNFELFLSATKDIVKDYRLHFSTNGGHLDACFMPVRPNLFLATKYFSNYELILPNWESIFIYEPTYMLGKKMGHISQDVAHKWRMGNFNFPSVFNNFINKYCNDWIGNYKETYFEVNVVMIDEKNMICIDTSGLHEPLFKLLHKEGINVHVVPWRTRNFWDGGIHCITLDVRRKAKKIDYFPERGECGIKTIIADVFDNDKDLFYSKYKEWLETKKL